MWLRGPGRSAAAEVDERPAADGFGQRGSGRPRVRSEVVDPYPVGRWPGVVADEAARQVDLSSVQSLTRVRDRHRQGGEANPPLGCRVEGETLRRGFDLFVVVAPEDVETPVGRKPLRLVQRNGAGGGFRPSQPLARERRGWHRTGFGRSRFDHRSGSLWRFRNGLGRVRAAAQACHGEKGDERKTVQAGAGTSPVFGRKAVGHQITSWWVFLLSTRGFETGPSLGAYHHTLRLGYLRALTRQCVPGGGVMGDEPPEQLANGRWNGGGAHSVASALPERSPPTSTGSRA